MSNRPIITFSLKPHLADYCLFVFKNTDKDGAIILNRRHDIGKMINSNIIANDLPARRPFLQNPCTFVVPLSKNSDLRNKFLAVSKWGEEKIQDFIEAEFDQHVKRLFELGYLKNYTQKQIAEAILRAFNIKNNALNLDAIIKNDYRKRKKMDLEIFSDLQMAV